MKITRSFDVPVEDRTVAERVITFFTRTGYTQKSDGLKFKRGSATGFLYSFNPRRWQCTAEVRIQPDPGILVNYDVRNDPMENSIARELWNEEADRLEAYLISGNANGIDARDDTKRVVNYVFQIISLPAGLFLAAVLGAAAGMYIYGNTAVSNVAAGEIGLAVFAVLGITVLGTKFKTNIAQFFRSMKAR